MPIIGSFTGATMQVSRLVIVWVTAFTLNSLVRGPTMIGVIATEATMGRVTCRGTATQALTTPGSATGGTTSGLATTNSSSRTQALAIHTLGTEQAGGPMLVGLTRTPWATHVENNG